MKHYKLKQVHVFGLIALIIILGIIIFVLKNNWDVRVMNQQMINTGLTVTNEPIPNKVEKRDLYLNVLNWKTCRDEKRKIEFLYPSTMTCSVASGPNEKGVSFDIMGSYSVENFDPKYVSTNNLNYRIYFIEDNADTDTLLDTEYSCHEGSCPNYPVSLSDVKIGKNIFKLSQSDTVYDTSDGIKPEMATRTVKMIGSVSGWTVYTVQTQIPYQVGKELSIDKDFGQLVIHEIINSINSVFKSETNERSYGVNASSNNNVTENRQVYNEKYRNEVYGIEMDVPSGLTLRETPTWQLVYDSSFPGNPEPDLALSVLSDLTTVGMDGPKTEYHNYLITFYKKTIDPKTLLGNHSSFNDVPGEPLMILGTGTVKIGNNIFQKRDFYSATMNGMHLYELAGNLNNGWTIYAWDQRTDNGETAVGDGDPDLGLLLRMIKSLNVK